MISAYSVCSAVIFYNLSLVLVFLLRRKTRFLARYSTSVLLFITVLGLVRLFTPVDLKPAIVIPSRYLLPAVQSALQFNIPALNISGYSPAYCLGMRNCWVHPAGYHCRTALLPYKEKLYNHRG